MSDILTIDKNRIGLGQCKMVELEIGRLPSGNQISIKAHVFRATEPGPCVLVMGGVHGDEINGVEIVRRSLEAKLFEDLKRGSVIAIPLLNIYGFINFSRQAAEGKDINRSFPGTRDGSLAARVARVLTKKVLPLVDFGVDFHTGSRSVYNYPQIRFSRGEKEAEELALAFGAPYILSSKPIAKSFRKTALDQSKTILVYEGGESLRFDGVSIQKGLAGLKRLLHSKDMLDKPFAAQEMILFRKSTRVRAANAGIFLWSKCAGNKVFRGEKIGRIFDPYGKEEIPVFASKDGYIVSHNNAPVVNQGDALFHIGYEVEY